MASVSEPFRRAQPADIAALVAAYPLAWVMAPGAPANEATLLPLIGRTDPDSGSLTSLIGHFGRRNPLHARLCDAGRAQILFTGPQGYVSPEYVGRRNWGPTWNYASVTIEAEVTIDDALTLPALGALIEACEGHRDMPWSPAELGARETTLRAAIIGFEARVTAVDAVFKLGQDETSSDLAAILGAIPDPDLREWMVRANPGRA